MNNLLSDNPLPLYDERPSRADAVKNRNLLLETARRLFEEYGVETVSMSAIAEAANVGKGTLYRHFESKLVLCAALLDEDQRALQDRTLEYLRTHHNPVENLHWFLREVVSFGLKYMGLLTVKDDRSMHLDHPAHIWWRQTIRGLLSQIKPGGDLDYLTDVLYVMIDPMTLAYQQIEHRYPQQRIEDGLILLVQRLMESD